MQPLRTANFLRAPNWSFEFKWTPSQAPSEIKNLCFSSHVSVFLVLQRKSNTLFNKKKVQQKNQRLKKFELQNFWNLLMKHVPDLEPPPPKHIFDSDEFGAKRTVGLKSSFRLRSAEAVRSLLL